MIFLKVPKVWSMYYKHFWLQRSSKLADYFHQKQQNAKFRISGINHHTVSFYVFEKKWHRMMLKNTTDQPIPKESNKINQTLSGRMKESYVLIFLWFSFRTECPDFADGRNRHRSLSFSLTKGFCSTYFKFWVLLKKLFGFAVPNFGVHQVSSLVSIIEKVMIDFFGPPGICQFSTFQDGDRHHSNGRSMGWNFQMQLKKKYIWTFMCKNITEKCFHSLPG